MVPALLFVLAATPEIQARYEQARVELATRRADLASKQARKQRREEAREALLAYLDTQAFPAWAGTPWDFYGTTTTPRDGQIACGYFVTTVLEQAGFRIERVRLAQQVSARIVETMAQGTEVLWLRFLEPAEVVKQVRERMGAGLFVVGLDNHVGFLRLDGERADFCHSAYVGAAVVACEDAATSPGFRSNLYVVGNAFPDATLDAWLAHRAIPMVNASKSRSAAH